MTDSSLSSDTASAPLHELPPSPKLVVTLLDYEGKLTQTQLAEETLLPKRTVRQALKKLEKRDIVTSRISVTDARKRIYSLNTSVSDRSSHDATPPTIQS